MQWPRVGANRDTGPVLPTPFAERVLDLVATIPPGRVLTYGDVAERLGSRAPRAVGTALARFGAGVPWWRVVRADGGLPPGHEVAATERLLAEGVPVQAGPSGPRVDLAQHRWSHGAPLS
jgi:alkylated DNA nucleotide flippase Atl1